MTDISLSFALILLLDAVLLLTLGNYFWMQNALFYGLSLIHILYTVDRGR